MDPVSPDWHEHFFEGLWLEVQPQTFSREETRADAEAVQELLQLMPGARVLDVPCGDGRVAVELATRGHSVTGVDRSAELIDRARGRARERHVEIELLEGDMWNLELDGRFDAALCLWHSFGYATEKDDLRFFRAVADRLAPGGGLVLDGHVAESLLPQWEERSWRESGPVLVAEVRSYDPETSRVLTDWRLARDGAVQTLRSSIRIYTYRELVQLLQKAGFEHFEACGSMGLEPFELGSSRLVLCARTPG